MSGQPTRPTQKLWFALLVGAAVLASAENASAQEPTIAPQPVELPSGFDVVLRGYESAWENRDAQALADLFTEDGFVLRPGHPLVRGRGAIQEAYANSGGPLTLRAYGYAMADSIGYVVGGFSGSLPGPDVGKFILTLRRHGSGRWLIAADMDNGN